MSKYLFVLSADFSSMYWNQPPPTSDKYFAEVNHNVHKFHKVLICWPTQRALVVEVSSSQQYSAALISFFLKILDLLTILTTASNKSLAHTVPSLEMNRLATCTILTTLWVLAVATRVPAVPIALWISAVPISSSCTYYSSSCT